MVVETLHTNKEEELIRSISSTFVAFLNSPEYIHYAQELRKTHPELLEAIQISPEQINDNSTKDALTKLYSSYLEPVHILRMY